MKKLPLTHKESNPSTLNAIDGDSDNQTEKRAAVPAMDDTIKPPKEIADRKYYRKHRRASTVIVAMFNLIVAAIRWQRIDRM